ELLGIEPRLRPRFSELDSGELRDRQPVEEMSGEDLLKEIAEDQKQIDEYRFRVHGTPVPRNEVPPDVVLKDRPCCRGRQPRRDPRPRAWIVPNWNAASRLAFPSLPATGKRAF